MPNDNSPGMLAALAEVDAALLAANELLTKRRNEHAILGGNAITDHPEAVVDLAKLILARKDRAGR